MGWIDFSSNGFCALKWLIEEQSITVGRTAKTQCICVRKPLDKQTLIVYHICKRYIKMNGKEILYNAFKNMPESRIISAVEMCRPWRSYAMIGLWNSL